MIIKFIKDILELKAKILFHHEVYNIYILREYIAQCRRERK